MQLLEPNLENYIKSLFRCNKNQKNAKETVKKSDKITKKLDYVLMAKEIQELKNLLREVGKTNNLSLLKTSKLLEESDSDDNDE